MCTDPGIKKRGGVQDRAYEPIRPHTLSQAGTGWGCPSLYSPPSRRVAPTLRMAWGKGGAHRVQFYVQDALHLCSILQHSSRDPARALFLSRLRSWRPTSHLEPGPPSGSQPVNIPTHNTLCVPLERLLLSHHDHPCRNCSNLTMFMIVST